MRTWRNLVAMLAVLGLLAVACDGGTAATTVAPAQPATTQPTPTTEAPQVEVPEAINVGAVIPLTGAFAGGGAQVERGYRYAVEAINEAGGVMVEEFGTSLPFNLIVRDDESNPNNTVTRMEELSGEGIVAYLGGFGSPLHAAAAAIAERNTTPYLGVAFALQSIHEQGFRYLFSPFPKSPDVAVSTFDMLNGLIAEGERPLRVGIFQESTDWGEEMSAAWQAEAAAHGYEVVVHETYAPGSTDYSDLILRAQADDVQALLSLPTPPDGFALYRQMGELGWAPPFSLAVRAADVPTWNDLGAVGNYALLSAGWHAALRFTDDVDAINERHNAEEGRPADPIVGVAYATLEILKDAIERAGTLDHEAVRDAIAATDMMTVAGPVVFRENGTVIRENPLMQRVDGAVELVWPTEFATIDLVYPAPPLDERS